LASTRHAYSLIAKVREAARSLKASPDDDGRHYFACLLYWNLRYLKLPTIRRVKKLLALFSSAEVLSIYGS